MTRPASDYTQNEDGTWREKTAHELAKERERAREAARGAGKTGAVVAANLTAQGPRLTRPKRRLFSFMGIRKTEPTPYVGRGTSRAHCPASRVSIQARGFQREEANAQGDIVSAPDYWCSGCGDQIRHDPTQPHAISPKTIANRSRKLWRKHRRKHGKNRRGW